MKPARAILSAVLLSLAAAVPASATVVPTHWYRMGEGATPPAVPGAIVTALHDTLGGPDLTLAGPVAALTSSVVPYKKDTGVATSLSLSFPAAGAYAQGDLVSTDTNNFGFETWIYLSSTSGTQCIAYNGTPGVDGWGLYVVDGKLTARIGPTTVISGNPSLSGDGIFYSHAWIHVAIVRSAGFVTLYVNRFALETFNSNPNLSHAPVVTPTGHFTLGATPSATGPTDYLTGFYDEARSFQVGSNFNSGTDFLTGSSHMLVNQTFGNKTIVKGSTSDLGSVGTGGSNYKRYYIENDPLYLGFPPVVVSSVTVAGGDAADFQISNLLPPFGSSPGQFYVFFRPTTPGPKSTTVTILSNDDDDSPFTFTVTATAVAAPNISIFPGADPTGLPKLVSEITVQTFADTAPGSSSGEEKTFTVRNDGLANLVLYPLSILGTDAADFVVTQPPTATTLIPGQSTTFTVKFAPSGPGTRYGVLVLLSNAVDGVHFDIPLAATATGPDLQFTGPDGTELKSQAVVVWGDNSSHQCEVPAGLGPVKAITVGADFTAALRTDGTVVVWGDNSELELEVPGLSGVVAISAGYSHLLALKSDGTVIQWGRDYDENTMAPAGLTGVTAIAAGSAHSVALKNDGTVVAWGYPSLTSVPPGLGGVTAIAADSGQTLALKSDGTVVEWGSSANDATSVPADLSNVTAIGSGSGSSQIALKTDSSIVTWETGHAPGGSPFPASSSPVISISARSNHQAAVRADGSIAIDADSDTDIVFDTPAGLRFTTAMACGGSNLAALYDSLVDFGSLPSTPQTFTLRNSGSAPLHLTGASITGPGAARYTLDTTALASTLAPGDATTISIAFNAQAAGPASDSATLQILSDAANRPAFTVHLAGSAPPSTPAPYDTWKQLHFSTTANTGDSADDADPNHNGITNLLEYALGSDPLGTASAPPTYAIDSSSHARLSFRRNPAASDITLTVQSSDTLDSTHWIDLARSTFGAPFTRLFSGLTVVESSDGANKSVTLTDASIVPSPPHRFLRLQATRN